jgi:hypothetical protein
MTPRRSAGSQPNEKRGTCVQKKRQFLFPTNRNNPTDTESVGLFLPEFCIKPGLQRKKNRNETGKS